MNRGFAIVISFIYAIVRCNIYWSFPTQVADGLLAYKWYAFIGNDVFLLLAYEGSINTFDGQRLDVITIGNLFDSLHIVPYSLSKLHHLKHIIFGEEIGPLPIYYLYF